jgi:putative hydrolase of the HAD superfamily
MRVDGVLFDVDDTLVDTRGAFGHALAAVARRYLPDVGPERDAEVLVHWRADVAGHYRSYTRGDLSYRHQRMSRANDLHAAFGGPELDDAGYDAWNALFEQFFVDAWAPHDDASRCVDGLLAAGLRVGALSNAAVDYQVRKLARVGLVDRVPMLVGVDTLGFGKPDPRVFVEACRLLGTEPARTAYVGDELDVDASAARDAGLVGIWIDRPGGRRHPDPGWGVEPSGVLVISTLDELGSTLGL